MVKLDLDKVDINQDGRNPIPAGTIVPLRMKLLPGNVPPDNVFVRSKKGDCAGLKARYTVTDGEHAGRNFQIWHLVTGTTQGHQEASNYTLAKLRAIVDAVHGLAPRDNSPEAVSLRTGIDIAAFFNGAVFLAEVGVEAGGPRTRGGNFADKNTLARILRLGDAEYQRLDQTPTSAAPPPHSSNAAGHRNGEPGHGEPGDGPGLARSAVAKPRWAT